MIWRSLRNLKARLLLARFKSPEEIFTSYYSKNHWKGGGDTTTCGSGSTEENTANIRTQLPILASKYNIESILDAPCGDFAWFQLISRNENFRYIGGDIVQSMIENNRRQYENSYTKFAHLNITNDRLPDADIWLCRDCLFHLSNKDIFRALHNFINSNINYLLVTNHSDCEQNTDIPTGHYRSVNLTREPFNFPEPLESMEDSQGKVLALWNKKTLSDLDRF